jgi:acyl-CoA-binding protein
MLLRIYPMHRHYLKSQMQQNWRFQIQLFAAVCNPNRRLILPIVQQLYGLFKYLTVSPEPNTARPGLLDFAGRAKWDAWKAAGQQYANQAPEVEERYLQIATELGWKERAAEVALPDHKSTDKAEEDIWDKEGETNNKSGGIGLGNSVSTVSTAEEVREEGTLHHYAVSGNTEGLREFLQSRPGVGLDDKDEYVRIRRI